MDCDGPKHVMIHDLDGGLTGLGPDSSVHARAEFMNTRRADATKYTLYNIPTKMLYDPAPFNNPADPGHDMSAYEALNKGPPGGGATFTYDRRLNEQHPSTMLAVGAAGDTAVDSSRHVVYSTADDDGSIRTVTSAEYYEALLAPERPGRQLAGDTLEAWKNRMVFYQGDERAFYPSGQKTCAICCLCRSS